MVRYTPAEKGYCPKTCTAFLSLPLTHTHTDTYRRTHTQTHTDTHRQIHTHTVTHSQHRRTEIMYSCRITVSGGSVSLRTQVPIWDACEWNWRAGRSAPALRLSVTPSPEITQNAPGGTSGLCHVRTMHPSPHLCRLAARLRYMTGTWKVGGSRCGVTTMRSAQLNKGFSCA